MKITKESIRNESNNMLSRLVALLKREDDELDT